MNISEYLTFKTLSMSTSFGLKWEDIHENKNKDKKIGCETVDFINEPVSQPVSQLMVRIKFRRGG